MEVKLKFLKCALVAIASWPLAVQASAQDEPAPSDSQVGSDATDAATSAANASQDTEMLDRLSEGSLTVSYGSPTGPKGVTNNSNDGTSDVTIRPGMSPAETRAVLLHEFEHVAAGGGAATGGGRADTAYNACREIAAISSAVEGMYIAFGPESPRCGDGACSVIPCRLKREIEEAYKEHQTTCTNGGIPQKTFPDFSPGELGTDWEEIPCY